MAIEWRPSSAVHRRFHSPQAPSRPNIALDRPEVVRQVVLGQEVDEQARCGPRRRGRRRCRPRSRAARDRSRGPGSTARPRGGTTPWLGQVALEQALDDGVSSARRAASARIGPAYLPVGRRAREPAGTSASGSRRGSGRRTRATRATSSAGAGHVEVGVVEAGGAGARRSTTGCDGSVSQARISAGMRRSAASWRSASAGRSRPRRAGRRPAARRWNVSKRAEAAAAQRLQRTGEDRRVGQLAGRLLEAVHAVGEHVAGAAAVALRHRRPRVPARRRDHEHEGVDPVGLGGRRVQRGGRAHRRAAEHRPGRSRGRRAARAGRGRGSPTGSRRRGGWRSSRRGHGRRSGPSDVRRGAVDQSKTPVAVLGGDRRRERMGPQEREPVVAAAAVDDVELEPPHPHRGQGCHELLPTAYATLSTGSDRHDRRARHDPEDHARPSRLVRRLGARHVRGGRRTTASWSWAVHASAAGGYGPLQPADANALRLPAGLASR